MKNLHIISHTHWDREWYEEFQEYRIRLVRMVDGLLEVFEKNPEYLYFHFDGQTIVLDDYLAIRPENREKLYGLIQQGKIIVGPWYVMPDAFLVSGESLVKNLQRGIKQAEKIGAKAMKCGYVVDIFGFNNQMPQLFKGFDIDNAVLFRGISDYEKDAFAWKGADNSEILVFKICEDRSYSNFYFAARWPFEKRAMDKDELVQRVKQLVELSEKANTNDVYLMLDGVDHIDACEDLPEIIKLLNENTQDCNFVHSTMSSFIEDFKSKDAKLEKIEGSLYSIAPKGLNSVLLKNVLSSIIQIKQQNDYCEQLITRVTQPLNSVVELCKKDYDFKKDSNEVKNREALIEEAWTYLLKNHPHDSICGCSITNVHLDNLCRFRQTASICKTLNKNMTSVFACNVNTNGLKGKDGAFVVFNFAQAQTDEVVILNLAMPMANQRSFVFYDSLGNEIPYCILDSKVENQHIYNYNALIDFEPKNIITVAMRLSLSPMGYTVISYDNRLTVMPPNYSYAYEALFPPHRQGGSMKAGHMCFDTGKITVKFNDNGTFNVTVNDTKEVFEDLHIFEDSGDDGDGYNFMAPYKNQLIYSSKAQVSLVEDNGLVCVVNIKNFMDVPVHTDYQARSCETVEQIINTQVILSKNSSKIKIKTALENKAVNHRMRICFPSYINSKTFYTKTAFNMTQWDIEKENWETAKETETFVNPNNGAVLLFDENRSIALYSKGLYEVEVTEDKSHTVALTLFRSFTKEVAGANGYLGKAQTELSFEYCLDFEKRSLNEACIEADSFKLDTIAVAQSLHEGVLPAEMSFVKENGGVCLSNFDRISDTEYILRMYNAQDAEKETDIELFFKADEIYLCNLNNEPIEKLCENTDKIHLNIGAKKIVSLMLKKN